VVRAGDAAPRVVLVDETGAAVEVPPHGRASVLVFYRGDWCSYCNGQLASYARGFDSFGGAVVYGVSVDPPDRNAAMIEKLRLPFSLLSDADGAASGAYGVYDAEQAISRPAIVVAAADGVVSYVYAGEDFSDRPGDDEVFAALAAGPAAA
jgi:peroxiredoxin